MPCRAAVWFRARLLSNPSQHGVSQPPPPRGCHTFIYNYLLHQSSQGGPACQILQGILHSASIRLPFSRALPGRVIFPREKQKREYPAEGRNVQGAVGQETSVPPLSLLIAVYVPCPPELCCLHRACNVPQKAARSHWKRLGSLKPQLCLGDKEGTSVDLEGG